jgi:hypothetical protein
MHTASVHDRANALRSRYVLSRRGRVLKRADRLMDSCEATFVRVLRLQDRLRGGSGHASSPRPSAPDGPVYRQRAGAEPVARGD